MQTGRQASRQADRQVGIWQINGFEEGSWERVEALRSILHETQSSLWQTVVAKSMSLRRPGWVQEVVAKSLILRGANHLAPSRARRVDCRSREPRGGRRRGAVSTA